jgi:hypothetical protein
MKVAKAQWSEETPAGEGWYWMQYRDKHGEVSVCPCYVAHLGNGTTLVRSALNDTWVEGPRHGGPGLKESGRALDRSVRFGARLVPPEA